MISTEARKMDILLSLRKKGYNLKDTEDPAVLTMDLGNSYTLLASVKREWLISFDDGVQKTEYQIDSVKVPFTNAKDANKLYKEYENELKAVLEEIEEYSDTIEEVPKVESFLEPEEDPEEKAKREREENKRKLEELEKLEQAAAELEDKKAHAEAEKPKEKDQVSKRNITQSKTPLLDMIYDYVGNDVLEVFGDTGSGKTAFVKKVAYEAANAGKRVFYLDTERNLTKNDIDLLKKCKYQYTPVINEIDRVIQTLPAGDLVILDSVGFPVLTTFARMNMKQKGDALLKMIAIFGSLKEWAYKNNGIVLVTNQPESEFNKEPNHILRPFGDKSQFAAKEIWETVKKSSNSGLTESVIKAFRSRSVGYGKLISNMKITDAGVEVVQ